MLKTKRRNAVEDVLGDESPIWDLEGDQKRIRARAQQAAQKRVKESEATETAASVEVEPPPSTTLVRAPSSDRQERTASKKPAAEPLGRVKRMKVSIDEERMIDEIVTKIGRRVGTKVQFSHVARAIWSLLLEAEDGLESVAAPRLHRPGNGNLVELAEFEAELATYLLEAFKYSRSGR